MTLEDKTTLLYFLTSPYSNIIGVYPIVLRIAAAEMGWTAEQLLAVLKRLESKKIVLYDDSSGFVWIMNWWDHNSAKMAVAPALRAKTYAQIDEIPAQWRTEFLQDFLMSLPSDESNVGASGVSLRNSVAVDMTNRGHRSTTPYRHPTDTVSTPCQQPTDRVAANTTNNFNSNFNHNVEPPLEFPKLETSVHEQLAAIVSRMPQEKRQDVLDEITAQIRSGTARSPIKLANYFAKTPGAFVISEGLAIRNARAQRLAVQRELDKQAKKRGTEQAVIDAELRNMSEEQFKKAHNHLPSNILHQLRDRWLHLRGGSST